MIASPTDVAYVQDYQRTTTGQDTGATFDSCHVHDDLLLGGSFSMLKGHPSASALLQGLLENTIQSHGSYLAHLTDALAASGAEVWRITPNVDAAFPYDLSHDAGDRAAANRAEVAALLAVSILTSVREQLVTVSCGTCVGTKHPTN
jgi:hypothetical protein